ncbi:MAG: hypothetical protein H6739_37545 [Alphaproteobacteria bacterium]|nr:hypothetical protein [Alphaproteobacteria bacterium]
MSHPELVELAEDLEAEGLVDDAERLRSVNAELAEIVRPPGLFSRMTENLRRAAETHWQHVLGELEESRELWQLLRARMAGERELTPEETDAIRAQLLDIFRVVPAGLVAVANSVLPIPATSMFTPWLLHKMGLMPSRWREAHALAVLEREHAHLRALGRHDAARRLNELIADLEEEADAREAAERRSALLTFWDANENGAWDPSEEAAYQEAVARVRARVRAAGHQRCWYLQLNDHVFGPVRFTELSDVDCQGVLLICYDGRSGWVALHDVLEAPP